MAQRWDAANGVVTPEAVPLQFDEANVGSRAVGFFIDAVVVVMALAFVNTGLSLLLVEGSPVPQWVAIATLIVVNFVLFFGYWVVFETVLGGRTLGKLVMGLRVVTLEGAPLRFRHAAIRAALGLVDFVLTSGVGAVMATLLSKRHQRLGDMVAGTVVLRERTGNRAPRASWFAVPGGAESYARTLDPSGLAPAAYDTIREFLLRAHVLRADARESLARDLATGVAAMLSHTPPAGVSPELFLVCVAARYQERERQFLPPPPAASAEQPPAPERETPPVAPATQPGDFLPPS